MSLCLIAQEFPTWEGGGVSRVPSVARLVRCWPSMKLHRQAHVVYKTQYHLVWVTRYRRKILVPGVAEYLKKVLRSVREFHPD